MELSKRSRLALIAVGIAAVLIALGAIVAAAGASGGAPGQPLAVQATSLVQDGQDLVWQVELAQPFSPGALARDHEALCLLIEGPTSGAASSQVCVSGPSRGQRTPRLISIPSVAGVPRPGRPIAAAMTRSSDRELTASFLPDAIGLTYRPLRWQVVSTLSLPGCVPPAPGGTGCATLFPARPALLRLHTPRLVGCIATGSDWVYHGPSTARQIALTFDDGPWDDPPTVDFVNELARLHAPATFFEIGRQIAEYDPHGTVERQMLADGDMIGDHTWSHPDMVGLPQAEQRQQLSLTASAIRTATGGFEPCLFRAPYGAVDPALLQLARGMGFTTIQWDIDPRDWALPGESEIISNVLTNAHNGGIAEEHFGGGPRYETLDALPAEVAGLRRDGYQLVTLTQMLGYKLVYR